MDTKCKDCILENLRGPLTVSLNPQECMGTLTIGDTTMQVYLGEVTSAPLFDFRSPALRKHKFTLIEI